MRITKLTKAVTSLILISVFICSMAIPAFAQDVEEIPQEESFAFAGLSSNVQSGSEIASEGAQQEEAPVGLLATPKIKSIDQDGLDAVFTWDEIDGAYKYQLFYFDTEKNYYRKLALVEGNTYTLKNVKPGVEVAYTIRCVDENNAFTSNYDKNGVKFKLMLETPKITRIEDAHHGINIMWGKIDGATKYKVFVKKDNGWKIIGETSGTSFNYTSPPYATRSVYTVRCVAANGVTWESAYDANGHGYTFGIATPKVSSVVINDTKGTLDIKWNEVIDAEYYRVYIKNASGGDWTAIGEVVANPDATTTSYSWSNFASGQSYTFTLRCVNNYGYFVSDYDSKGYTYTVKISTPKITEVTKQTGTSVKISWNGVAGADRYRIFYKNGTSWKTIADTTNTSYTWTGATIGKAYTYTVRCVNNSGKFSSDYDKNGVTYTLLINTPKITLIEKINSNQVRIVWGAVSGAVKYRVFYKNGSSWKTIATTSETSYTWKTPAVGQDYTYTVRCLSADGKYWTSDYDSTGVIFKLYLDTPVIKSCEVTAENKFKISWDKITGASKYRVFYYVNSKKHYVKIGDTTGTSFNVTSAKLNSTYRLTVRCISADASKWESDYDIEGFIYKFELATPVIKSVQSQGGTEVKITWNAITGAPKYVIFRKDNPWKIIGYSTTNSFTWNEAVVNTSYTFTVRCCDSSNSFVSGYDSKGFAYKHQLATPYITSIVGLDDETVKIAWTQVKGAYAYRVFYKSGKNWIGIATTKDNRYTWDRCEKNKAFTYTVRCVGEDGQYASSFDSQGYPYTITNVDSKIADVAVNELNYWKSGMHGYSCQGNKYCNDLGVNLYDWCGYFATYCCKTAGIPMFQGNKTIYGYVGAWKDWGDNNNQWHPVGSKYTPCPGDMVIWGSPSYYQHVTVVVEVDEEKHIFYDVGGNEVSWDYTTSVVNRDGPFDYTSSASNLVGFVGTHILG